MTADTGQRQAAGRKFEQSRLGKANRVVLPARVREALGVVEGDHLLFTVEDGKVSVQSLRDFTRTIQAKYAGMLDGAVDELIAERRAEAERE